MKRMQFAVVLAVASAIIGWQASSAFAIREFQDEFLKTYYKPDSEDAGEKKLAAAIDKIKKVNEEDQSVDACIICHGPKAKKVRNAYGKALDELLDKKKDKMDAEKIQAALLKVAEQKSSDDGPTFGELLKKGVLPEMKKDSE
ncbi:MAG: hypothetical protein SFX18_20310 [Pirellulales bacterium]|nr:hypothetical protein [Pirellulales bacterium]